MDMVQFRNYKLVYRRYAGLFFCVCVDANDNELAYLEAIHLFVEVLDAFFGNVCELDLVFNFYKVYAILDEVFLAGEIEETSKHVVLARLDQRKHLSPFLPSSSHHQIQSLLTNYLPFGCGTYSGETRLNSPLLPKFIGQFCICTTTQSHLHSFDSTDKGRD